MGAVLFQTSGSACQRYSLPVRSSVSERICAPFSSTVRESIPLFIPTDELLEQYNNYSEDVQRKLECLKGEIKNATEARDRLLPKLMSGELEV